MGAVHPISEIFDHHNAHIYGRAEGLPLPSREEYYVSEDGEAFYKVGEHVNKKHRHRKGVERFTSGPIRTKGRYVLVRTFPQPGIWQYAGFDEIVVRPGDFGLETVALTGEVFMRSSSRFDREVFGFRISPPDWRKLHEHLVNVYLEPHGPFGHDTYFLSTGDAYDLRFRSLHTSGQTVEDDGTEAYFGGVDDGLLTRDLVFLGPDIGLRIGDSTEGHLLYDNVECPYGQMGVDVALMVFQYISRFIRDCSKERGIS